LQLRSKYPRQALSDGRGAAALDEMSTALDSAERSSPGFVDRFVSEIIDGMLSSSLQWTTVDAAIQKTKRSEREL